MEVFVEICLVNFYPSQYDSLTLSDCCASLCILVFLVTNIFKAPYTPVFIGLILLTWKQPVALFTFLGSLSSLSSQPLLSFRKKLKKTHWFRESLQKAANLFPEGREKLTESSFSG